jgi:hypothetical protein
MQRKRTKVLIALGLAAAFVVVAILIASSRLQDERQIPLPPLAANAPCADVLLQLDDATTAWAEEHQMNTLAQPDADKLKPYFKSGQTPACPQGGRITFGTLAMATTCSLHGHAVDKRPARQSSSSRKFASRILHIVGLGATTVESANACVANLRQIDGAKQQWALENKKRGDDVPAASDIAPFLIRSQIPVCSKHQGHGKYILNAVSADPQCTRAALGHTL